ncbi:MAG: SOS response-associated peptidase [Pseudomonadota bacterium]
MCNLYSQTKSQDEIRHACNEIPEDDDVIADMTGNLPAMPGIYPDYPAPILRPAPAGGWQLSMARWGLPTPPQFLHGIRTEWTSTRKLKEGEVTVDAFAFLTCAPNREVARIHPKAMPVILLRPEECRLWLTAPIKQALHLQRALPDGELDIVLEGAREDPA